MTMQNFDVSRTESTTAISRTSLLILFEASPSTGAPIAREARDLLDLIHQDDLASGGQASRVLVLDASADLDWSQILEAMIADGAVTNSKIALLAVENDNIAANTINAAQKLVANSVTEGELDALIRGKLVEGVDLSLNGQVLTARVNLGNARHEEDSVTLPTGGQGGSDDGVVTGLSYNAATRKLTLARSVGGNVVQTDDFDLATTSVAGLMSHRDKGKLDNIDIRGGIRFTTNGARRQFSFSNAAGIEQNVAIPNAGDNNAAGLMIPADKTRLDALTDAGIEELARDAVAAALRGTGGITITPNDAQNTITINFSSSAAQTHNIRLALSADDTVTASEYTATNRAITSGDTITIPAFTGSMHIGIGIPATMEISELYISDNPGVNQLNGFPKQSGTETVGGEQIESWVSRRALLGTVYGTGSVTIRIVTRSD